MLEGFFSFFIGLFVGSIIPEGAARSRLNVALWNPLFAEHNVSICMGHQDRNGI